MAKKPKSAKPKTETSPAKATPDAARGTKTAAIRTALKAHPKKQPKEIAELLQAEGWDITPLAVSGVKSAMKAKKKAKTAAAAPVLDAAPAVPKDAVSVGAMCKAKKLVQKLGGIKQAKTAVDALAQLLD